jgi:hypothetical protein
VFDAATGEPLGGHMVGAEVTELIQGYVVARTLEGAEAELMHAVFPHPTPPSDDALARARRLRRRRAFLTQGASPESRLARNVRTQGRCAA